jgi:hypothetical protein
MGADFLIGLSETENLETLNKWASNLENAEELAVTEMATIEQDLTLEGLLKVAKARDQYPEFESQYEYFYAHALPSLLNSVVPDVMGFADDNHTILKGWGFDLGDVMKPVTIWNGTLDKGVSPEHANWQHERIAGSVLRILDGQNHSSIMVETMNEILGSAVEKLRA